MPFQHPPCPVPYAKRAEYGEGLLCKDVCISFCNGLHGHHVPPIRHVKNGIEPPDGGIGLLDGQSLPSSLAQAGSTKGAPYLVSQQPCSRQSGPFVNLERRNDPDLLCYWGARRQRRYFPIAPPTTQRLRRHTTPLQSHSACTSTLLRCGAGFRVGNNPLLAPRVQPVPIDLEAPFSDPRDQHHGPSLFFSLRENASRLPSALYSYSS